MDIFSKKTFVEHDLAEIVNLYSDTEKLEMIADRLEEEKYSASVIANLRRIKNQLITIAERIEDSFENDNDKESS